MLWNRRARREDKSLESFTDDELFGNSPVVYDDGLESLVSLADKPGTEQTDLRISENVFVIASIMFERLDGIPPRGTIHSELSSEDYANAFLSVFKDIESGDIHLPWKP